MSCATRGSLLQVRNVRALICAVLSGVVLLSLTSSAVHATGMPTNLQASVTGTDGTSEWAWRPTLNASDENKGDFWVTAPDQGSGSLTLSNIALHGNVDPVINGALTVTNNTALTQNYTFIFSIPIVPQGPLTVTGGSMQLGVTDNTGNGATAGVNAVNLRPTYYSQIDGADWQPLNVTPLVAGGFGSNGANASFGNPIPSLLGPPALLSIGIRFDFSLTPGDSATASGVFVVEAIPEPASCMLVMAGLAGCLTLRRRG